MSTRTLLQVCAALCVISVIAAASLWRELRAERERSAALLAGRQASLPAAGVTPQTAAPTAIPLSAALGGSTPGTEASALPPSATPHTTPPSEQELLNDPEYRKARLAMLRAGIMRAYPGVGEALRLSNEETARFFDLMAETQLAIQQLRARAGNRQSTSDEIINNRLALQRQQADSIRELLGESRYRQWLDYQPTRSSRVQATAFAGTLAEAGMPLDSAQLSVLETTVAAEEKRLQQDIVALGRSVDVANPLSRSQAQEALTRRQEEGSQRVLDAASPYLSAQQRRTLRSYIEQQNAVNRAMAEARESARQLQAQP